MKKVIDFQSGDIIMIEKSHTFGKLTECSYYVRCMFERAWVYYIDKEPCGFHKIVKCSENMTA